MTDLSDDVLRALPKAELHLHLEGSVAAATLADLARKHGLVLPARDLDALYVFDDLASFLQMYGLVCAAVRDADDFFRMTYEALASISHSGGRYAELFFSPDAHEGVAYATQLDGILAAVAAARLDLGVDARVIPAHNRERGPEHGMAFLEMVLGDRRDGVVGIGLDYMENDPRPFAAMYERRPCTYATRSTCWAASESITATMSSTIPRWSRAAARREPTSPRVRRRRPTRRSGAICCRPTTPSGRCSRRVSR
jgi:adenosine deaminase